MRTVILKNKHTTERRKVVYDSDEYAALMVECDPSGNLRWAIDESEESSPTYAKTQRRFPTDAEIKQGAGVAAELPPDELKKLQKKRQQKAGTRG